MTPKELNEIALISLRMTEQRVNCVNTVSALKSTKMVLLKNAVTKREQEIINETIVILERVAGMSGQRDITEYYRQLNPTEVKEE